MTSTPTCDERVDEHLAGRLADLRSLFYLIDLADDEPTAGDLGTDTDGREVYEWWTRDKHATVDDLREQAQERLDELPLGADMPDWDGPPCVRVQLSTGGPGDEFLLYLNSTGQVYSVEYRYLDWWDSASRIVTGDDRELIERAWGELADSVQEQHRAENPSDYYR